MNNYNKLVDALKNIARDGLRMELVSKTQTKLAEVVSAIQEIKTTIMSFQKDIARANFAIDQLVEADPDFEEKKKEEGADIECLNKEIKNAEETIVELEKAKTEIEEKITKIEAGEIKVSLEKLNEMTSVLIKEVMSATAVEKAKELGTAAQ